MNRTFKIISRDKKTKRQDKKRVYTSEKDFKKYAQDVINRYRRIGYDVEAYELIDEKWLQIKPQYVICSNCNGQGCSYFCDNTGKLLTFKI